MSGIRWTGYGPTATRDYRFARHEITLSDIYRSGSSFSSDPPLVIRDGEKCDIDWEKEEMHVLSVDGQLRTTVKLRREG